VAFGKYLAVERVDRRTGAGEVLVASGLPRAADRVFAPNRGDGWLRIVGAPGAGAGLDGTGPSGQAWVRVNQLVQSGAGPGCLAEAVAVRRRKGLPGGEDKPPDPVSRGGGGGGQGVCVAPRGVEPVDLEVHRADHAVQRKPAEQAADCEQPCRYRERVAEPA